MKIKLLLSITVLFFVGLFAIPGYSQTQMISISNLKYTNGAAIPNGTSIKIAEGGTVSVTFDLSINNPQMALVKGGTLSVYSKLNSNSNIQHVSINFGQNAITGTVIRQCTIDLRSVNFPTGTGSIYAQFSPMDNSPITGTSVPVKVVPLLTSNYIVGDQTVYEGDPVASLNGPAPNGGDGLYTYSWQQRIGSGGVWTNITGATGINFKPTNVSISTISYRRIVTSLFGTLISTSNEVIVAIYANIPIQNNEITLSGSTILGTLPTGGTGNFRYEYYIYHEFADGEIVDGVSVVGFSRNYDSVVKGYLTTKFYRKVYSGNKVSTSNTITIPRIGSSAKTTTNSEQEITTESLIVYPNPTSESLNFSTNFSTNKEIEIVVYSDKLGNEKSVFKGTVTPNQVVNWNIPASYQKGIYFYKILSGNKEVKTGKIIVQ